MGRGGPIRPERQRPHSHSNFVLDKLRTRGVQTRSSMELFAGFNAEELAMMQELLRLLVEDDDVLTQQPTPHTNARQESQVLFDNTGAGGMIMNDFGDYYSWGLGVPNGNAWNAAPEMMAPEASRTRTRSNFTSDDEPMLKRGRVDVAPTMRTPMNRIPVPEGSYPFY